VAKIFSLPFIFPLLFIIYLYLYFFYFIIYLIYLLLLLLFLLLLFYLCLVLFFFSVNHRKHWLFDKFCRLSAIHSSNLGCPLHLPTPSPPFPFPFFLSSPFSSSPQSSWQQSFPHPNHHSITITVSKALNHHHPYTIHNQLKVTSFSSPFSLQPVPQFTIASLTQFTKLTTPEPHGHPLITLCSIPSMQPINPDQAEPSSGIPAPITSPASP
jgi:hypothetical protein